MSRILTMPYHLVPEFYGYAPNCMFNLPSTASVTDLREKQAAESDVGRKQLIPYVLIFDDEGKMFWYIRSKKGGESRLHHALSVGVGGHIEDIDFGSSENRPYLGLAVDCALRELKEEVGLYVDATRLTRLGWINDNSNSVGKVHLGALFGIELKKEDSFCPDQLEEIDSFGFEFPDHLRKNVDPEKESWSDIVLRSYSDWSDLLA